MKKIVFFLICFLFSNYVYASDKIEVTLNKCVDGDTAWFNIGDEIIKTRFLAIDTPESTNKIEPFGKEASEFTCNLLTNSKIEIKYDKNSDKTDKYDRHLVWVFVDGKLLQEIIIKNGLGETAYLYDDYEYTDILESSQIEAKLNKVGMWKDENNSEYIILIIVILIIIVICIFNKNFRDKVIKKTKKEVKKIIKKEMKS